VRRPSPADLGLLLLTSAVVVGAVKVVTHDPAPPAAAAVLPSATPTPTPTPSGTTEPQATGRLLLVGADLDPLSAPLGALGWTVDTVVPGSDALVEAAALEAVPETPALVAIEVPPGERTSERVTAAVTAVREAFPDAAVALVGPFDPEATATTGSVRAAAAELGVVFVDPVDEGWTDGLTSEQIATRLSASLGAALL